MGDMPNQHVQEHLSRAYVHALATEARVAYRWKADPDYGIDGELQLIAKNSAGKIFSNGRPLEFQLKASTNCVVQEGKIAYDLDVQSYNSLVKYEEEVGAVCLLLYSMPDDMDHWVSVGPDQLILRTRCYYWIPHGDESSNANTKRIHISDSNVLMPAALQNLIRQLTH
jgi:hypothetical protein